jgi:hypothetical protein
MMASSRRGTFARARADQATMEKKFELAPTHETKARHREVQLLLNIAEPDPEYQAVLITDEASLLDATGTRPEDIERRLAAYFGVDLELDIGLPIWQLVDEIKRLRPGWPDDFGAM